MGKWIDVKEKLPERDGKYIVTIVWWSGGRPKGSQRYEEVQTDVFANGEFKTWPKFVTHWMPMPEAPENPAAAGRGR